MQDEIQLRERLKIAAPLAIPVAVAYGLLSYQIWFPADQDTVGFAFFGILISLPVAISSLAVIFSDPKGQASVGWHASIGALAIFAAILIGFAVLKEGGICAVMAAPIYFIVGPLSGMVTGWLLRRLRARNLSCFSLLLPAIALPIDPQLQYSDHWGSITTMIEIDAPPAVIWQNTVAIRDIKPDELGWTFSHAIVGVPQPVDARMEGAGAGAVRYLKWGQGIRFQEHVTEWEQDRFLSWRFHFEPDSIPPEVEKHVRVNSNYLELSKGYYRLDPLPNGRTRLTLTTEYRLATPINGYCAWWGGIFLNDFHQAVLGVIRDRSERGVGKSFTASLR